MKKATLIPMYNTYTYVYRQKKDKIFLSVTSGLFQNIPIYEFFTLLNNYNFL